MNTTKLHIERILAEHGIVAVPGLGTFVARRVSSSLNGNKLSAPGSTVGFEYYSEMLEDGELCASLSRALNCETSQATNIIAEDIENIRREISLEGQSIIGNCGSLRSDDSILSFEAKTEDNWLQKLSIEPLSEIVAEEEIENENERRREAFMRSLRRTASSAAAIAIFVLIAFIFSQMPGRRVGDPQVASMGFEQPTLPVQPISGASAEPSLVLIFNTPADASCPVESEPIAIAQLPKNYPADKYCLVVASLASRADAEEYVATYGSDYKILEKDGRYRIYTLSGPSFSALNSAAAETGEFKRHPNAWICRK